MSKARRRLRTFWSSMIGLCWWLIQGGASPRSLVEQVLGQGARKVTVEEILWFVWRIGFYCCSRDDMAMFILS
ncbi:Uncharacterized protein TCM_044470 [Theobroma cacao]|uniref:Secreted protein n=1 Tax=Theobroma cacao TaxID=3641 RepID=A0A061FQL6_THECC|nr:Uncharacterized protein TCM_044470 [Theobroma cacao]